LRYSANYIELRNRCLRGQANRPDESLKKEL
jgi:hypothetical protein